MRIPPKIISEIQSKDWLKSLFNSFEYSELISPKLEFRQDSYTHELKTSDIIKFISFEAYNFSLYLSNYFKYFRIEFDTNISEVFTNQDKYCTNETFTRTNSWNHEGKRMSCYYYITDETITELIITKQTENNIGVILSHSTILKEAKKKIDFNLHFTGKFSVANNPIVNKYYDYSDCSIEEFESLKKWKNIELSKKTQMIQNKMNEWVENLYECSVEEPNKRIRAIYINENQKQKFQQMFQKSDQVFLNLDGEFIMFDDYTAILKSINKLKQVKH